MSGCCGVALRERGRHRERTTDVGRARDHELVAAADQRDVAFGRSVVEPVRDRQPAASAEPARWPLSCARRPAAALERGLAALDAATDDQARALEVGRGHEHAREVVERVRPEPCNSRSHSGNDLEQRPDLEDQRRAAGYGSRSACSAITAPGGPPLPLPKPPAPKPSPLPCPPSPASPAGRRGRSRLRRPLPPRATAARARRHRPAYRRPPARPARRAPGVDRPRHRGGRGGAPAERQAPARLRHPGRASITRARSRSGNSSSNRASSRARAEAEIQRGVEHQRAHHEHDCGERLATPACKSHERPTTAYRV